MVYWISPTILKIHVTYENMVISYSAFAQLAKLLMCFNSPQIIKIIPCNRMYTELENDYPCPWLGLCIGSLS